MKRPGTRLRIMGEFTTAQAMQGAVERLRSAGYERMETYSPFGIPGMERTLGLRRSLLPLFIFVCGAAGLVIAYWIQWYADVWDYPLDVGNRPVHPVLAFIPATFEGTVLAAALGAFVGLLLWIGLPKLWDPVFEVEGFERATIDRFWIAIEHVAPGADAEQGARLMEDAGAVRVVRLENAS